MDFVTYDTWSQRDKLELNTIPRFLKVGAVKLDFQECSLEEEETVSFKINSDLSRFG